MVPRQNPSRKFRLSHRAPVDPPMETSTALGASFLNRHEVVLAEAIYNQCNLALSWHQCGKSMKKQKDSGQVLLSMHKAGIPAVPSSSVFNDFFNFIDSLIRWFITMENDMVWRWTTRMHMFL